MSNAPKDIAAVDTRSPRRRRRKRQPKPKKHVVVFTVMALLGTNLEVLTRVGTLVDYEPLKLQPLSLAGWTSLWMLPVYGAAGLALGLLNEVEEIRRWPMVMQCLLGLALSWAIELGSGCILNIQLGLAVWDYSQRLIHIEGQICLITGIQFFLVAPFVFWADDLVRYLVYRERKAPDPLIWYYRSLFSLQPREVRPDTGSPARPSNVGDAEAA